MNISSIGAGDNRPGAAPAPRRLPAAREAAASVPERTENTKPSQEDVIASSLASLDDALESGNLDHARSSLSTVRKAAELPGDESPGFGDPLSGVSKALKSGDIEAARSAWSDFRAEVEDDQQSPDVSINITGYSTFSIVA